VWVVGVGARRGLRWDDVRGNIKETVGSRDGVVGRS
jgi:hypothetical protein